MVTRPLIVSLAVVCAAIDAHAQSAPLSAFESLGLRFERNVGQVSPDAIFVAHGAGYDLLLTTSGAVVRSPRHRDVRVVFTHSDVTSLPTGEGPSAGVVNYLRGNDPTRWLRNIPTFGRVRYPSVYPGIDVVYHASQGQMEYDLVVDAGADPRQIRMRFDGADRVTLQDGGELAVQIGDSVVTVRKPVLYQDVIEGRRVIDGAFVRLADGEIGFDVGPYDAAAPLVIDPVLVYSSYLPARVESSSSSQHTPFAIAVAPDGATFIAGSIPGSFAGLTNDDAFVAKVNPSGSSMAFVTYLGGSGSDSARSLVLGASGEIYLGGRTSSYDFPVLSAAQPTHGGGTDGFLTKLSAAGDALDFATFAGGSSTDAVEALVIDADANAYLVGTTNSTNFPLLSTLATFVGLDDVFVVKYNSLGMRVFSTLLGGTSLDLVRGARLAPDGALIVVGETISVNFPVTPGALRTTLSGFEGFVSRLRASDGTLLHSTYLGGNGTDRIRAVNVDASGAVYLTGETSSSDFPVTTGVVQPLYGSSTDAFVMKLTPTLGGVVYSTYLGGLGSDSGNAIAVDALGRAVVTGSTGSPNFPQFAPLFQVSLLTGFIAKLSANGSQFVYSTFWPSHISAMTLGPTEDAYVAGTSFSSSSDGVYPTTADALSAPVGFDSSQRGVFARISDASAPCSFSVRPTFVVASFSSTYSLAVVAPSECFWAVTSNDPTWLNPVIGSGVGTGTFTFTVPSLTSGSGVRSGTLVVGNGTTSQTVTVYQRACFVSTASVPLQPSTGGSIVVNLTGIPGCPFVTWTEAQWLTVGPAIGFLDNAGQGQLSLTFEPNTSIASRSVTVYAGDSTKSGGTSVTQAGRCTTSLSSTSFTAHRTGASTLVTVTVTPPDCLWAARSDSPWLTPSVASAVGSQTIAITAAPTTTFRNGRMEIAGKTFTVSQNGPSFSNVPIVYPPLPSAGSGHHQTFTFTILNSNSANNLSVVNVLINNFLDGASACYLAYTRADNVLYLVNDGGDALLPGMVLNGGIQTIANSQCAIDGSGSFAVVNGNLLTLTLKMAFSPEFAGNKVVYQAARTTSGFNSGWLQQGVWNVPGPDVPLLSVESMTPSRNAGTSELFRFTLRNLAGADQLVSTSILINNYLDGFRACYLGYHVPTNSILLLNDAGNGYIASVTLGSNLTVENSQCRIRALQSSAEINGTDLTLTLMLEFKAGFAGDRVFYVSAQDGVSTSGWEAMGSWTVP